MADIFNRKALSKAKQELLMKNSELQTLQGFIDNYKRTVQILQNQIDETHKNALYVIAIGDKIENITIGDHKYSSVTVMEIFDEDVAIFDKTEKESAAIMALATTALIAPNILRNKPSFAGILGITLGIAILTEVFYNSMMAISNKTALSKISDDIDSKLGNSSRTLKCVKIKAVEIVDKKSSPSSRIASKKEKPKEKFILMTMSELVNCAIARNKPIVSYGQRIMAQKLQRKESVPATSNSPSSNTSKSKTSANLK
jgi:hypothetical protein